MICCSILNYLSIPICLLNVFVTSTNDTGFGGPNFKYYDEDWPIKKQHSPTHKNDDSSRPYDLDEPALKDIQEAFLKLYSIKDPLEWQEIVDNNTEVLQRTCFAAWTTDTPKKTCESKAIPYNRSNNRGFIVMFHNPTFTRGIRGASFLRCKCYTDGMKRRQVQSEIKPLYLAKYDNSSVFLLILDGDPKSHRLRIIGKKPLNVTDISSRPSVKPSNRTSSPLTWNLTQLEKEFFIMYRNYNDGVKWQAIRDNATYTLQGICIIAWEDSYYKYCNAKPSYIKCYAKPRPYTDPKRNGMKAMLVDDNYSVTVRADFLQCKCSSDTSMSMRKIKEDIEPVYFAKYDHTTVFKLMILGRKDAHNLKIIEKKTLINI